MKRIALAAAFFIAISCFAQVKQVISPLEKYRQSSVSELEFRKLKFDVVSIRLSTQPTPLASGVGSPFIEGETADGKITIQVDVSSSLLPQSFDARKQAMMDAVGVSLAAWSYAFDSVEADKSLNRWAVINFWDNDKFLKAKGKPVDPWIGVYENGELTLR